MISFYQITSKVKTACVNLKVWFLFSVNEPELPALNDMKEKVHQRFDKLAFFFVCFIFGLNVFFQIQKAKDIIKQEAYFTIIYQWVIMVIMFLLIKIPKDRAKATAAMLWLTNIRNLIPLVDPY